MHRGSSFLNGPNLAGWRGYDATNRIKRPISKKTYNGGVSDLKAFDYTDNLERERKRVKAAQEKEAANPTPKAPPSRRKGTVLSAMNSNRK